MMQTLKIIHPNGLPLWVKKYVHDVYELTNTINSYNIACVSLLNNSDLTTDEHTKTLVLALPNLSACENYGEWINDCMVDFVNLGWLLNSDKFEIFTIDNDNNFSFLIRLQWN